jgi:protein-disulfide isomerase
MTLPALVSRAESRVRTWTGLACVVGGLAFLVMTPHAADAATAPSPPQAKPAEPSAKRFTRPEDARPTFALDERFRAGRAGAPVKLVIYACPREKACAKLLPDLHREVTIGRLKNKVALYYRPFFPAGNEEAVECGRGLYAAAYQGKFWPYLIHLCLRRDSLSQATFKDWVGRHGLDRCVFDATCMRPETDRWLSDSHKEGMLNGVTSAPAVFINGRRIEGKLDLETLVGLLEKEHKKLSMGADKKTVP